MSFIRYTMLILGLAATTGLKAQNDTIESSSEVKRKVSYHFHIYAPPKPKQGYITAGGNGPLLSFAIRIYV